MERARSHPRTAGGEEAGFSKAEPFHRGDRVTVAKGARLAVGSALMSSFTGKVASVTARVAWVIPEFGQTFQDDFGTQYGGVFPLVFALADLFPL